MIIDKDIIKLNKTFVTKHEFRQLNNGVIDLRCDLNNFKKSVDIRFSIVEEAIDNLSRDLAEFREQTAKTLDWLVGAFKKFDEEHSILTAQYSTIGKTIDNHETRITSLEKSN